MASRLLSIVVVSYNTRDLLRRCLASIVDNPRHAIVAGRVGDTGTRETESPRPIAPISDAAGDLPGGQAAGCGDHPLPCEILVVDNDSKDGSADMVESEFPQLLLLRAQENLGFARATNLGLAESHGELLLLLNPDTEVIGDALVAMADFLSCDPTAAAVGPALMFPDGRPQHGAFGFPTLWMSLFDFFPINHRLANSRLNGRYSSPEDGRPFPVDHPLGAAMMIKRPALQEIGLLDDSFFIYCEEVDWCLRARRDGWRLFQLPSARVIHHVAQSTRQLEAEMLVELHRSRYRLFRKHYSPAFVRAHRAITLVGLLRRMMEDLWAAGTGRISRTQLDRRVRAYRTIWGM